MQPESVWTHASSGSFRYSVSQRIFWIQILKTWGVLLVAHIANDTWCYFEYILHIEASKHDQTNTPNKEHNQNILWNFFRSSRQAKSIPANTSKYSPLDEYNKSLELECSNAGKTWPTMQITLLKVLIKHVFTLTHRIIFSVELNQDPLMVIILIRTHPPSPQTLC